MSYEHYLVILSVAPALEDAIADCLRNTDYQRGFFSYNVRSQGVPGQKFSVAEQVIGHQKKIQFQIRIGKTNIAELLTRLKQQFAGAGLEYWVVPVIEQGWI